MTKAKMVTYVVDGLRFLVFGDDVNDTITKAIATNLSTELGDYDYEDMVNMTNIDNYNIKEISIEKYIGLIKGNDFARHIGETVVLYADAA